MPTDQSPDGIGVLYRVHWRGFENPLRYFASISHSPASRPGKQHGWSMGLRDGADFDALPFVEAFTFRHSPTASDRIIQEAHGKLFPPESIIEVAKVLLDCPAVTMRGIKAALARDGCPSNEVERMSNIWGERLCNGLTLDIHRDEEFALTEEQLEAGRIDAAKARASFLSGVGVRLARIHKDST